MKKIMLLLLFLALFDSVCFSRITHNDCDHEWQLTETQNGKRYWKCLKCGDTYTSKKNSLSQEGIAKSKKTEKIINTILLIIFVSIVCFAVIALIAARYKDCKSYDEERHFTNTITIIFPFMIVFSICVGPLCSNFSYIGILIALVPSLTLTMICMIIGYTINISRAKHYNLPDDDPSVQEERTKRVGAIISSVVTGISTGRHIKKAIKDIENVDGWKEMK